VLSPDGQPISGASVYAVKSDFTTGRLPVFPTNDRGEFTIPNLTPGTYKVSAAKEDDGYPPTDYEFYASNGVNALRIAVYEGQTTSQVVVNLGPKAAKLVGKVIDAATDKLVKDVQIIVRRTDNPDNSFTIVPDVNGKIEVLVPPVPFTVEVSAPGYEKRHLASLQLSSGEIKRLDITLHPAR
jgi:hypothetical protein